MYFFSIKMIETKGTNHSPFFGAFVAIAITATIQTIMLLTVLKCREYLSLRENHALEVKIAEKGKSQNPAMEIVIAGRNTVNTTQTQSPTTNTSENVNQDQQQQQVNSVDNPVFGV